MNVDTLKKLKAEAESAVNAAARDGVVKLMPQIWKEAEAEAKRGGEFISVDCWAYKPPCVPGVAFMRALIDIATAAGFECRQSEYCPEKLYLSW